MIEQNICNEFVIAQFINMAFRQNVNNWLKLEPFELTSRFLFLPRQDSGRRSWKFVECSSPLGRKSENDANKF